MNVGIRNLMKGRVGERGYEGESLTGEGIHSFGGGFWILGGGSILEGNGSTGLMACFFFLVLWESFSDDEYHCRGHRVARGFGYGGQDSFWFPGARDPDRLLLDGWVDSRFGQCWSVHWARQDSSKAAGKGQSYRRELASEIGIYM
jgi:hypothetical protein